MQRTALHRWVVGLVRRTWIIAFVTVVVCATFAAHAARALTAPEELVPARTPPPPKPRTAPVIRNLDGSPVVERNMFCSMCLPDPEPCPTCENTLSKLAELIETSMASDPRATLRVLASEVQGSWGLGDSVPGLGQIVRIGPTSIDIVDLHGRIGRLSLREVVATAPPPPTTAPQTDPWAGRIKKLDDKTYEVDRQLVRDLVGGVVKPGTLRVLPIVENGEVKGLRFYGVGAGSIPAALGLKTGDTITQIDGEPIKNINQLLDLLAKLDQINNVEIAGTRAGKPLWLGLRLR
jgi:PDZ domain-containing protein